MVFYDMAPLHLRAIQKCIFADDFGTNDYLMKTKRPFLLWD